MKDYKELDQLVFDFGHDMNYFVENYAGRIPADIKQDLQGYMYSKFSAEMEELVADEQLDIKCRKKFYTKLFKAKRKLATLDKADAWFNKIFQKYFNRGLLEHLVVHAVMFLHKKGLFVPERFFVQLGDDELLARFTLAACQHLGWTGQNEPVEQPTTDEGEPTDEQTETDETADSDAEQPQDASESTDVAVYEPKEVQPVEQPTQPVVKVERTVTHEVMTATQHVRDDVVQAVGNEEETDSEAVTDNSVISEEELPHRFHRPGGGKHK